MKFSKKKVNYYSYIRSKEWRTKRLEYFLCKELTNDCRKCKRPYELGFHLHHRTYARLGSELLSDLVMLCEPCHSLLHKRHLKGSLKAHTAILLGD